MTASAARRVDRIDKRALHTIRKAGPTGIPVAGIKREIRVAKSKLLPVLNSLAEVGLICTRGDNRWFGAPPSPMGDGALLDEARQRRDQ